MRRKEKILKKKGKALETTPKKKKRGSNKTTNFYDKYYKQLMIIPFLLLLFSIINISMLYSETGDFFHKGISLSGGITITLIDEDLVSSELETQLINEFEEYEVNVRTITDAGRNIGLIVESNIDPDDEESDIFIDRVKELTGISEANMSVESVGSSLGEAFFRQTFIALLFAFLFMGIVVFAYFRSFIPSAAVILAAASNIIVTVAFLNIINFKLGTAGIAALLMLIGYSVDTDILLTTRLLKEKEGTIFERLISAMKTGITMTGTTLIAVTVAYIVADSQVLREIILVVMVGLVIDLINTWLQNASILRWYIERRVEHD